MSIREFRRLPRASRRAYIDRIADPLTRRVMTLAFLGPGKRSWRKVATMIGGGNTSGTVRVIAWRALNPSGNPPGRPPKNPVTKHTQNRDTIPPKG